VKRERRGGRILIHSTSPDNIKVTTPFDLRVADFVREYGHREGRGTAAA
jgi:2-C-methyl-D-erythritol 4-phosphate cytidylyltransferase